MKNEIFAQSSTIVSCQIVLTSKISQYMIDRVQIRISDKSTCLPISFTSCEAFFKEKLIVSSSLTTRPICSVCALENTSVMHSKAIKVENNSMWFTHLALQCSSSLCSHFKSFVNNLTIGRKFKFHHKPNLAFKNGCKFYSTCLERSIAWSVSSIDFIPASISCWFDISTLINEDGKNSQQ